MVRLTKYLIAVSVAVAGSIVLPSWPALARHATSAAIAIAVIAAIEWLERKIRAQSSATFKELAEVIDEVFWIRSADFREIHYVSPAYERVSGYSRAELYADTSLWRKNIHPDDLANVQASTQSPTAKPVEYRMVHRDGSVSGDRSPGLGKQFAIGDVEQLQKPDPLHLVAVEIQQNSGRLQGFLKVESKSHGSAPHEIEVHCTINDITSVQSSPRIGRLRPR